MPQKYFPQEKAELGFTSSREYTDTLFAAADFMLNAQITRVKDTLTMQGGIKNALYADIEVAAKAPTGHLKKFLSEAPKEEATGSDDEFAALLGEDFMNTLSQAIPGAEKPSDDGAGLDEINYIFDHIESRVAHTDRKAVQLRFLDLCERRELSRFSVFCFVLSIMACTQTDYSDVFQIINRTPGAVCPSVESAARTYFGADYYPETAFPDMSDALEQLQPLINMQKQNSTPFSAMLMADKRLIDYLFGARPMSIDKKYSRFCSMITSDELLDPIIANKDMLESMEISNKNGVKIFALSGDEGAGRRFTIKHFCRKNGYGCISVDCGKLFKYDFSFVESTLWGISRECILTSSVCCLHSLEYHEEEKDKIFGFIDLSFSMLTKDAPVVFTLSEFKLPLREITSQDFTVLEFPTPNNYERAEIWEHYAKPYTFEPDVDLFEMATKFLFTGGKIKNSLRQAQALCSMHKLDKINRQWLFEACYSQMKHELTQKATKVKATYTWDDIIMPPSQRQTLEYVCDQMKYRKKVFEDWNYNRKYPYGRGLSVLLFGHPGTGKTMCAQVLANALNLELYRVDLSKVIDKYVGETEKSISMIFREAKKCNVVLFFDEADTMFGKRTDSGGSGESAANNKTAHLLQEIEAYDGVSVLATNFKHNIDPAFFRRMKFVVEFAFPDPETRYRIWKATIPKSTPLAEDVDLRFLANRFEFVGGNIKNCILNAAFLAAADGDGSIMKMKHLLLAVKFELIKTGKVFTKVDFEPYANEIIGGEDEVLNDDDDD